MRMIAERQRPALVLRGQHEEHEQHAQREDESACCRPSFCWYVSSVHS